MVGDDSGGEVANAELYDPATNSWSAAGTLGAARRYQTANLLPSGKVLVAGGLQESPSVDPPSLASAELYDLATNTWAASASMRVGRLGCTPTVLPSGKVLAAGGSGTGDAMVSAEIYDPRTDTWDTAADMETARAGQTATLLPSGRVLVAGGQLDTNGHVLSSAELYTP